MIIREDEEQKKKKKKERNVLQERDLLAVSAPRSCCPLTPRSSGALARASPKSSAFSSRTSGRLYEHMDYGINTNGGRCGREDDNNEDDICRSFYIKEPLDCSPRLTNPRRATIRSSKRFFTSPIIASSLMEEARLSGVTAASSFSSRPSKSSAGAAGKASLRETSTPMTVFSEKPYDDFRRSMAEMMKAHHAGEVVELDWEFMEQMLFRYLELNDRSVYQDIIKAFADLASAAGAGAGAVA